MQIVYFHQRELMCKACSLQVDNQKRELSIYNLFSSLGTMLKRTRMLKTYHNCKFFKIYLMNTIGFDYLGKIGRLNWAVEWVINYIFELRW